MAKSKKTEIVTEKNGLDVALDSITALLGDEVRIRKLDSGIETTMIKSGYPSLDFVTDGGFPKNKFIELVGVKSSGKSSLALQIAESFGDKIVYIDTEYTLTTTFAKEKLGVDTSKVTVVNIKNVEGICNAILKLAGNCDVIIWDSLQNTASQEEWQKPSEQASRSNRAKVLSKEIPKIVYECEMKGTTLIVLSQVSQNQDRKFDHDPEFVNSGGERLNHNLSLILWLYPSSKEKGEKDEMTGYTTINGRYVRIVCEKNKNGVPFRTVKLFYSNEEGYSLIHDVLFSGINLGIIKKSGSWYSYNEIKIGQGEKKVKQFLIENPELMEEIKEKIYETYIDNSSEFNVSSIEDALKLTEIEDSLDD